MATKTRQGEMVRRAFAVLLESPDGLPAKEVIQRVSSSMSLTDFEKGTYPKNPKVRRFDKMIRFATIGPVKAGWLRKENGRWRITDEGTSAYKRLPDPEKLFEEWDRLYKEWAKNQPEGPNEPGELAKEIDEAEETPGAATTLEEAEEDALEEVREYMHSMNPYEFQELVAALLRAMGHTVAWVADPGPDRGFDILAYSDPLGVKGPRIKVQVRHRRDSRTDVDGLNAFMAVLGDDDVGIFVSSGGFTKNAKELARIQEKRKVTLVDLDRFFELWVRHQRDLDETDRQRLPLKAIHFLAPRI